MPVNAQDAKHLLETLAFNTATDRSQQGTQHGSRLAKLAVNSWQAEAIRQSSDVVTVETPTELRRALEDSKAAVIFLPQTAMVTPEIIERACCESPFNKMIIWETDG